MRPIREPSIKIYLFSNSLESHIEPTHYINLNSLKKASDIFNDNYEGLTKTEIYNKIAGKTTEKIRAIEILQFTGKKICRVRVRHYGDRIKPSVLLC
ncbi:MAG: hypothetical protein GF317_02645 [Candidatus Lokiarchaeota archaeon]|nr:hypothetical protein [Candidatus Lokiarchaeota archaeon]MBD3198805.1 hypothetical protein [Candidatus Lokiarchaeota archaeon]